MKIFIVFTMLTMISSAQTAKVIQLSQDDAKQAKALTDEQTALDKRKAEFEEAIRTRYLTVIRGDKDWGDTSVQIWNGAGVKSYRAGWDTGRFEYSEDFKFIVPKTVPSIGYGSYSIWGGCSQFVPSIGAVTGTLTGN